MKITPPEPSEIRSAVERALAEDLGPERSDLTTQASLQKNIPAQARIFTREPCVLAGLPLAEEAFRQIDPGLKLEIRAADGAQLKPGDTVLEIIGPAVAILTAERTALNFMQQLSGVATRTAEFVQALTGLKTKILDTRKTTPGLRALQKYAVRCGGGTNHRFGLYDQFLLKDNHLALLGSHLAEAIQTARRLRPQVILEVEADRLEQVREIVALGVDVILLDNMSLEEMRASVETIAGRAKTEASGNMTLERVRAVAETGVDFISVGALTHSVRAIDFSLEIIAQVANVSEVKS